MSKAFTKEDEGPEAPLLRGAPRLAPGEKRYITPEGYARIQAELEQLAASVPLSESDKARAEILSATLAALTVVPFADRNAEDGIFFGAAVELEDEDGEAVAYQLVGPDEIDVKRGFISIESPIAKSMLGKRVGDSFEVVTPRGSREYTVKSVRYGSR